MKFNDLNPAELLTWIVKTIKEADYLVPRKGQKIGEWIETAEISAMEWFILITAIEIRFGIEIHEVHDSITPS